MFLQKNHKVFKNFVLDDCCELCVRMDPVINVY